MAATLDPAEVFPGAHWLAQAHDLDSNLVRFVAMEPGDYRAASFLDDRMFDDWREVRVLPWRVVAETAATTQRQDARWIFHIGHVGSTLVSRMLGEIDGVLSIREPRILRDLAHRDADRRSEMAPVVRMLCSRSFAANESSIVKATSFVSEIAQELVSPQGSAILMHVGARSYIETILAGENSVKELLVLHDFRAQRMLGRVSPMARAATSNAHRAAMAWACEMTALESAADAMPELPILWLDFDDFLANLEARLMDAARHFGIGLTAEAARAITGGPLMSRYSKDLGHDYSPAMRLDLQADARRIHGTEIESALQMLDDAGRTSQLLARALGRAVGRQ